MNEFCAAMGVCNLRHLDDEVAKRKIVAERYWELLDGVPGARAVRPSGDVRHNYAYTPVLFDPKAFGATRDDVFEALAAEGVGARKYFFPLVSDFACYRSVYSSERTPVAKRAAQRGTDASCTRTSRSDIEQICEIVRVRAVSRKKSILLLGGSAQQVVAIGKARELGYRTVLCDYLPDNPGQHHADSFHLVSTTDREAVLKVAREEGGRRRRLRLRSGCAHRRVRGGESQVARRSPADRRGFLREAQRQDVPA